MTPINRLKESPSINDCETTHKELKTWAWNWFIAICTFVGFVVVYLISFNVWITNKASANETDIKVIQKENLIKDNVLNEIKQQNKMIIELLKGKK